MQGLGTTSPLLCLPHSSTLEPMTSSPFPLTWTSSSFSGLLRGGSRAAQAHAL